ncbi:MAG: hypothetical protein U0136_17010 [Bdellovibrionota bacterium]
MGNGAQLTENGWKFAPRQFDLTRLLKEVFQPSGGERVAVLIDLDDPKRIKDFSFLEDRHGEDGDLTVQQYAYEKFYLGLKNKTLSDLSLKGGEIYAYQVTGGSNLDLPDQAFAPDGKEISLERDLYPNIDIVLCISSYSATAPLTAFAKQYGFRGATLHGVNKAILESGLSVSYEEVSAEAEKLRLGMTGADSVTIDFTLRDQKYSLTLELGRQEAQKSHGLCRVGPDICNLPAGEIYFVPENAFGQFPLRFEDGTIALFEVKDCALSSGTFISGSQKTFDDYLKKIRSDSAAGRFGELGFGTQKLPVSGRDIQDEKIFGTLHVATGRSDHLGGDIVPGSFKDKKNATHEDILFAPTKTPEINVAEARMKRNGETVVLIRNYQPAEYMLRLLEQ